ncbi:DUF1266 domain-containing protein [Comamonas sp. NoAH]|uniref:DUF1266 domain-containing protein n=1 Tax=Comamonas halotolerans TaxID=3041496 RepID=UPI0024E0532B|nr:DUF1266 domain-containing protein [Comamonas sp. NoAH]
MKLLLPPLLIFGCLAALAFWLAGWWGLWGLFLLLVWLIHKALGRAQRMRSEGHVNNYRAGSEELNIALALAHPLAFHCVHGGIADEQVMPPDDHLAQQLRPMLLHHLGLRTDLDDVQIQKQFPDQLRQRWFKLDLQQPHSSDDPRASMAFACARVAFFVRCAHMMGWVPKGLHEDILRLNARRARDCFGGWLEFGNAYARGRQQWVALGRSDILGVEFSQADVSQWLQSDSHPWNALPWQPDVAPSTASDAIDVQPAVPATNA